MGTLGQCRKTASGQCIGTYDLRNFSVPLKIYKKVPFYQQLFLSIPCLLFNIFKLSYKTLRKPTTKFRH